MTPRQRLPLLVVMLATVAACGGRARLPVSAGIGPQPELPPPRKSLLPLVHIAPAKGWPTGSHPEPAEGAAIARFAAALDHPRWLYVLPNGDVLVAETAAPPRPEEGKGIRAKAMGVVLKKAGAAVTSANRITLLRDADGDGVAELRSTFLQGLNSPFGMAMVGNHLYVANTRRTGAVSLRRRPDGDRRAADQDRPVPPNSARAAAAANATRTLPWRTPSA